MPVAGHFTGRSVVRWGIIGCGEVCEVKSGPAFQKAQGSALVAVVLGLTHGEPGSIVHATHIALYALMIALPLALIAWRFFRAFFQPGGTILCVALLFGLANAIAAVSWDVHKLVDGPLLVVFFAAGSWSLLRRETVHRQPFSAVRV